jgi:hypothetical protein
MRARARASCAAAARLTGEQGVLGLVDVADQDDAVVGSLEVVEEGEEGGLAVAKLVHVAAGADVEVGQGGDAHGQWTPACSAGASSA